MATWSTSQFAVAVRTAARTFDLLVDAIHLKPSLRCSLRGHRTICDPPSVVSSAADDEPTTVPASPASNDLISRFSEMLNLFPRSDSTSLPQPGARPLKDDPLHYNLLMKSFSRVGKVDEVLRLLREMKNSDCKPNALCYTTVIDALVESGRYDDAEQVFEEMIDSGVTPDSASCTVLVKLYTFYLKRFDSAYEMIKWMVRSGCDPDVVTYSTLIAGLCRAGLVNEAWDVLDEMLQGKCLANAHSYAPFLQTFCAHGKIGAAVRLMESMRSLGCPPDTVAYNILINGLCKTGNFEEVARLLDNSESYDWKPDAVSYNTYISELCKDGKAEEAFRQLEIMLDKKLCPTVVTVNIVLDSICWESTAWEGKCQLERSMELGLEVDVVSYNTIMSRLCEIGNFSWVLKLFTDMLKKGIKPSTESFNIMIRSLCKSGKFRKATCIFTSKGFVADIVTCNTLIHEFYTAEKMDELKLLFSEIDLEKIGPDTITYNTVINCLCRNRKFSEAINFVKTIKNEETEPLLHLICWLVRARKMREVIKLLNEMPVNGTATQSYMLNHLINAFCRMGLCQSAEMYEFGLILDKMLEFY